MNADAKFDPFFRRHPGVALDEAILHFDGAALTNFPFASILRRRRSAPDVLFVASNDIRAIHGMVIVADEGRLSATQMTTALLDLSPTAVTSVKPETTASASKNSSAKATKPAKEKPRDSRLPDPKTIIKPGQFSA